MKIRTILVDTVVVLLLLLASTTEVNAQGPAVGIGLTILPHNGLTALVQVRFQPGRITEVTHLSVGTAKVTCRGC